MSKRFSNKRFAYIKSDNAAEELRLLSDHPESIQDGPLTYISQFLFQFGREKTLLLSFGNQKDYAISGSCQAFAYKRNWMGFSILGKIYGKIKIFFLVLYHLMKFKPDYILCAGYRQTIWASFFMSKMLNATLVHTRHNRVEPANAFLNRIMSLLDNMIITRLDFVICNGIYIKEQLLEIGVAPPRIIEFRPGFKKFFLTAMEEKSDYKNLKKKDSDSIIGFVGRMVPEKGVFDLLEACAQKLKENPSLRLVYIGEGPALNGVKKKISSYNLNNQIECLGKIANEKIGSILKQCKFVVIPTRSVFPEGFGKAAIEPMIFGKPVIAPNFGPFPTFITNLENGLLYKVDSIENLKEKIIRLLDDEELYQNLSIGAKNTGASFIDPPTTFSMALLRAFGDKKP